MEITKSDAYKKKLKDFLFEGLMIFIAVTLGFFAESLRETISNNEKERHYIESLIQDLIKDSTYITHSIRENKIKISGLDSLISLSSKEINNPAARRSLYKYSLKYISFYSSFLSSEATMMQLKNSSGLQIINRNHVADSIAMYDQVSRSLDLAEAAYSRAINEATEAMSEVLIFRINPESKIESENLPLITNDSKKIEVFFNKVILEKGWTQNYVNNLANSLPITVRLIAFLRKEYDL